MFANNYMHIIIIIGQPVIIITTILLSCKNNLTSYSSDSPLANNTHEIYMLPFTTTTAFLNDTMVTTSHREFIHENGK
jgi:uncharacterized protein YvpB